MRILSFTRYAIPAGGLAAALALAVGPMRASTVPSPATDRSESAVSMDDQPTVLARSATARIALGIPDGVETTAVHVTEASTRLEYDEVTSFDESGRPVSLTGVAASGMLVVAVRFDIPPEVATPIEASAATEIASRGLTEAGVSVAGTPVVEASIALGGWDLHWPRLVNGVPVRGDEVRVHVRDDGDIGSVGQVVHGLAAAPLVKLTATQARALATKQVQAWTAKSGAGFAITGATMQWVGPNAAFDSSKIGAPQQPYRLAWVVTIAPQGNAASYAGVVVLFIDAGDGTVIGGDMVE